MKKITYNNITWVDIKNPNNLDIDYLGGRYNIHPLILNNLIPPSYRSRVEQFDECIYLVIYFPVFYKDKEKTETRELDIVVSKEFLITSHYKSIIPLKEIFDKCKLYKEEREKYVGEGTGFLLYKIIDNLLRHCLPKLDHISEKIDSAEDRIFNGEEKEMVQRLSIIKRDILDMGKAIRPQNSILKSLNSISSNFFGKKYNIYFQDLLGSYQQVSSILKFQENTIESLSRTNESLLSNKVSRIMQILTIASFITFPLTIIVGFFGMNIFDNYQFIDSKITIIAILLLMVGSSTLMTILFKRKQWL